MAEEETFTVQIPISQCADYEDYTVLGCDVTKCSRFLPSFGETWSVCLRMWKRRRLALLPDYMTQHSRR